MAIAGRGRGRVDAAVAMLGGVGDARCGRAVRFQGYGVIRNAMYYFVALRGHRRRGAGRNAGNAAEVTIRRSNSKARAVGASCGRPDRAARWRESAVGLARVQGRAAAKKQHGEDKY